MRKLFRRKTRRRCPRRALAGRLAPETLEPRRVLATVGGVITDDTTWTLDQSPYEVTSDISVLPSATLEIEPGVEVLFADDTGIMVTGRLLAAGTAFDRITFDVTDGAARWDGIEFNQTLADSRITFADMRNGDGQGEAINVDRSRLLLDNVVWEGTTGTILELEHPSLIVRNSHFPTSNGGEIIHGERLEGDEYLVIQGNVFENSNNGGDVIDVLGADRPGPVMQILNNVFKGGGDDGIDLDGTDAHVEGNLFMNFSLNTGRDTTSNAIATGLPQSGEDNRTQITVVRNIFMNSDHALLLKEDAFATVENNLFIGMREAVIQFDEVDGTAVGGPGLGAYLDGNIFHNNASLFKNLVDDGDFKTTLDVHRSLLPNDLVDFDGVMINAHDLGEGNIDDDPQFVDEVSGDYRLGVGSPAIAAGPGGLDMGAYVLGGPTVNTDSVSSSTGQATFTVAGPGITHYRYRLNNEPYGPLTAVDQAIALNSLPSGDFTLDVIGMNSAGEWYAGEVAAFGQNSAEIIAPTATRTGESLPMIVRIVDWRGETDSLFTQPLQTTTSGNIDATEIRVKKGVGSAAPTVTAASDFELSFNDGVPSSETHSITLLDGTFPVQTYGGELTGDTVWDATADRHITADLTIPVGSSLTIQPGTRVLLDSTVNVLVEGGFSANGTADEPIVLNATDSAQPWGGLVLIDTAGSIQYTFLTNGGADSSREFGHSNSQPLIFVDGSTLECDNCYVINNPGKGFGARRDATVNIHQSVISDVDTGGEFNSSLVTVTETWLKNIPKDDDGIFDDDDNDGFYFNGVHSSDAPSRFQDSYVIETGDDGLDHNGARLEVVRAWIEGADHEGIASSNRNDVRIDDSVFIGNNQGVEAGYRDPDLFVTNSVIFNNRNDADPDSPITAGVRFGDGYDGSNGSYTGHITAANLVVHDNGDNVRNWDGEIGAPQPDAIDLTNSLTNDADYDDDLGNRSGVPVFGPQMHLLRGSAGRNAGNDGLDVGRRIPAASVEFQINNTETLLRINEVLASASPEIAEQFNFIELLNGGQSAIDLSGYRLSDDPNDLSRFEFTPGSSIGPGETLTLVAALQDANGLTATGYLLSPGGGEITLFAPQAVGGEVVDSVAFHQQIDGRSLVRSVTGQWTIGSPTPAATNLPVATAAPTAVKINEWLAEAAGTDFIELYNSAGQPTDIGGLLLTNDPNDASIAAFGPLTFIPAEGLLTSFTSPSTVERAGLLEFDLNAGGGELSLLNAGTFVDRITYGPQTEGISQGRRPNGGEFIDFFDPPNPQQDNPAAPNLFEQEIISVTSEWKYDQSGDDLGAGWRETTFNDAAWDSGPGILFVEESNLPGPKSTELSLDADGDGEQTTTYYFRHEFVYDGDLENILEVTTLIDDGAVFYMNGVEVLRQNMDPGPVSFDTFASNNTNATAFTEPTIISAEQLVIGTNVLAVEVHQDDDNSSDIVFAMTLVSRASLDTTPPTTPSNVSVSVSGGPQAIISWDASQDPDSGVLFYRVFRDGNEIGTTTETSFVDAGIVAGESYEYAVSAVNGIDLESPLSASAILDIPNVVAFRNGAFPDPSYNGTEDTWLRGTQPDTPFGNNGRMDSDGESGASAEWTLLRWDVSSIAPGTTVEAATITFTVTNPSPSDYPLYAMETDWVESAATWNSPGGGGSWEIPGTGPSDRGSQIGVISTSDVAGTYDVSLNTAGVDLVSSWINDPSSNRGLIIFNDAATDGMEMRSSNFADVGVRPMLTLVLGSNPLAAPEVMDARASLGDVPQSVIIEFTERVFVDIGDLRLQNTTTGEFFFDFQFSYDEGTDTATWQLNSHAGVLPPGDYRASVSTEEVVDLDGNSLLANEFTFSRIVGDTDGSQAVDGGDVGPLCSALAQPANALLDLNEDGTLTSADVDLLVRNILGSEYGDANVDGVVDGEDYNLWAAHRFTAGTDWTSGDFNCDGTTDGSDFNIWNDNRFVAAAAADIGLARAPRSPLRGIQAVAAADAPVVAPESRTNSAPRTNNAPRQVDPTLPHQRVISPQTMVHDAVFAQLQRRPTRQFAVTTMVENSDSNATGAEWFREFGDWWDW